VIYLDHNATTPTTPAVRAAMLDALENEWANPSSLHRSGQEARRAIERARRDAASLIGAKPGQIVFTSGGTESASLAIKSIVESPALSCPAVVTTRAEHPAVRTLLLWLERRGRITVRWAPIETGGAVRLDDLEPLLDGAALVSIQWAGNETGTIQPVRTIAKLAHAHGCLFHCDATQMVGKAPVDVSQDDSPDLLTLASHKFHGPKGVGALYAREGVELRSSLPGSQELGRRGGTENVPGIVGMAAAAREAVAWLADETNVRSGAALRDHLEREILGCIDGCAINGEARNRLWNTTNIAFPVSSEALLMSLSERGVCASGGAACASGSLEPSPVLLAMGLSEERAARSVRLSLSRFTTRAEVDEAVRIIVDAVGVIRA
jgi:cysteine desulfurase